MNSRDRIPFGYFADRLESTIGFEGGEIRETWMDDARIAYRGTPAEKLPPFLAEELFWGLLAQAGIQYRLLLRIARLTWRVRVAQRAYFAEKSQENLKRSLALEAELDALLAELAGQAPEQAREAPAPEPLKQVGLFERAP